MNKDSLLYEKKSQRGNYLLAAHLAVLKLLGDSTLDFDKRTGLGFD
jgi:hypothetical protein